MNIVELISDKLTASIKKNDKASIVVSGGSSLLKIFEDLSNKDICWSKVQVTLVDDRLVDARSDESNQKLINEKFLINNAKNAKFFPLNQVNHTLMKLQLQGRDLCLRQEFYFLYVLQYFEKTAL